MKLILLKIAVLILLAAIHGNGQTITQEEFINRLKNVHPLFESEKLTAKIENEERNSYLGEQDWMLTLSTNYSHEESEIAFSGPDRTDAISINGEIEKIFWATGGKFSASIKSSRADINLPIGTPFPSSFYQNQLAVTYTHPLLKNRNGFLNKLQYDLKKFDIDISEVRAIENQENFLVVSASKFLDWVFLTEQVKIINERLRLSEEELKRIKKKRASNLIDQVDVIRAEDAVSLWKQNLVLIESHLLGLQAELAELSQDESLINAKPEFNIFEIKDIGSVNEAKSILQKESRLLQIFDVRLKQIELSRNEFEETVKPDLSAFAQVNTKNLDKNFSQSFVMDKPSAVVGLQFSMPIGNQTAHSNIRKTEFQTRQLRKQRDDLTISLSSALANLNKQITQFEQVLKLNQDQIESAKERTTEELKLYNQGRGELIFVIQSQDSEQNAKLTYASNALSYQKLLLKYKSLMDRVYN